MLKVIMTVGKQIGTKLNNQAILTSNLDESASPTSLEFHQWTGYLKGQEFEAQKASQSQQGWDQIIDCSVTTCKVNKKEGFWNKIIILFSY